MQSEVPCSKYARKKTKKYGPCDPKRDSRNTNRFSINIFRLTSEHKFETWSEKLIRQCDIPNDITNNSNINSPSHVSPPSPPLPLSLPTIRPSRPRSSTSNSHSTLCSTTVLNCGPQSLTIFLQYSCHSSALPFHTTCATRCAVVIS
jgi:hypothetical protein